MKKYLFVLLLSVFSAPNIASAQKPAIMLSDKPGWHKISETAADFKADKQEIVVLGADKFKAVRLKVTDASMHIEDLEIYFENGGKQDVSLRADFKPGEQSKVINLTDGAHEVKKVVFVYSSLPNKEKDKAHVELYGLK